MRNNWSTAIKTMLAIVLFASVLAGCGNNSVSSTYPLESVTQDGNQLSKIYRAENKTVPEVAKDIADDKTPKEISKEDTERMFLVYPDELYHLQKDPNKPTDTLIEVDNKEFVQRNYDSSFLQGFLLASVLDNLFDSHKYRGSYRGYSSKDTYKPIVVYHQPSSAEKKIYPPITKEGKGSIFKRGTGSSSSSKGIFSSGDDGSGSSGKIIKSSDGSDTGPKQSSIFERPRIKSPPKTKFGGSGKIFKRRR